MEWEFFIASDLGMTVDELRVRLSQEEFVRWVIYHGRKAQRMELARG